MKGSVLDIIFVFVLIVILSITTIFVYMFISTVNDRFIDSGVIPEEGRQFTQNAVDFFPFMDQILIFAIGGMFVTVLVAGANINAHPVFFVGALLLLIIILIMGAMYANIFLEITSNVTIAPYAADFPYLIQFYQNAPLFLLAYSVVLFIVMFAFGGRNEF